MYSHIPQFSTLFAEAPGDVLISAELGIDVIAMFLLVGQYCILVLDQVLDVIDICLSPLGQDRIYDVEVIGLPILLFFIVRTINLLHWGLEWSQIVSTSGISMVDSPLILHCLALVDKVVYLSHDISPLLLHTHPVELVVTSLQATLQASCRDCESPETFPHVLLDHIDLCEIIST